MLHNVSPRAVRLDGEPEAGVDNTAEDGRSVRSTNKVAEPLLQDEMSVRDVQQIQFDIEAYWRLSQRKTSWRHHLDSTSQKMSLRTKAFHNT